MKNTRRFVMIAIPLSTVVLFFFLPSFFCLRPVLTSALSYVNSQIPGTTEVQSCSLGWWQGLRCEGIRYRNPAWGVQVTVPRLALDKGLLALLAAPQYLGEITVDQPTLAVLSPPAGLARRNEAEVLSKQQALPVKQEAAARSPWWERQTFRIKVNRGVAVFDQGQGPTQELAREIDLNGSLAVGTVHYALAFRSGLEQQGQLRAEGFINLPTAGQPLFDALISRTEVEITGLEIAAFLDLAASQWNFPKGNGILNATCHLTTAGIDDLEIQGETGLQGLHLSSDFLGQDQPTIDQLLFTFKGSHKGKEGWRLATLKLESEPVRIEANGSFDGAKAALVAKGSVNLPAVAARVPHLLSLHEKTTFKEGLLDFALELSGTPQELDLKADCRTGHLGVVHNGAFYSWDTPFSLVAEMDRRQGKTMVRALHAHAPYFDAQGSGGAENFTLRATADLDRMSEELEKIFALDIHSKGKMKLDGSSKQEKDGHYRLDTRIDINGFSLTRSGAPVLPAHDSLLTVEAWMPPSFMHKGSFTSLRLDGDFWPGKLSFSARRDEPESGEGQTPCSIKGALNLERTSAFFHGLAGLTPPCKLAGTFSFDGSGGWKEHGVSLERLDGKIEQLAVSGKGYAYQEPRVMVALANKAASGSNPLGVHELMVANNWQEFINNQRPILLVDFQRQRLDLRHLTLEAAGTKAEGSLSIGDWRQPQRDFAGELNGQSNAALPTLILKATGWLSKDMALKGRAQTTFMARSSGEQKTLTEFSMQMEPFELLRGQKKIFRDNRLFLKTTLLTGEDNEVAIPAFVLHTSPLQVEGTGLVQRTTPLSLELQGTLTPDLSFFSDLLASVTGQKMVLAGKREGVFLLRCPLKPPIGWNQMTLAVNVPVDSLKYQGVALRQFDMPVEAKQGKLRMGIAGELNGGTVALQPQWDFSANRLVMNIPPSSQVLKDVSLEQPLVDGVLAKMHPLFKALAQPVGAVDLRLDDFSWPLNGKGGQLPDFKATISLGKMRFAPAKVLQNLLDLGGFGQNGLQAKERELTCQGRAGRITCSPLHLLDGEVEIGISGSVGMDRTLECHLQMPLTESLADKVHLPWQQGGSVTAEITGKLGSPSFDPKGFLALVSAQLSKAAVGKTEPKPQQPAPGMPSGARQ